MSVKVAVRVRPFNSREMDLQSKLIIEMTNNQTKIMDINTGEKRDFTFDFSFWSHDGFETDQQGFYIKKSDQYADQRIVFDTVGKEILDNAFLGYHCCLFAYGQTGSGKSYSMVGYGPNKGIVPIACEEIFDRIKKNTNKNTEYEVQISMLEIYNERIQDLLIPTNQRTQAGLKVREHKMLGVYVENLTKHPVDSYENIEKKVELGNKNRSIGATLMNSSSSRAHTIICIDFRQKLTIDGKRTEKISIINLIDLAGSEKLGKTGASGDRMKEGCSINKSLSQLGLIIHKLAENATNKKQQVVPFRDSQLTRILQNALGGNSKTLMICALSPSSDNYEETLSTLRYADQAKKIKCNAVINESETDKLIRDLKQENNRLQLLIQQGDVGNIDKKALEKMRDLEQQLKMNAQLLQDQQQNFQQKLAEQKKKDTFQIDDIDLSFPYLKNLNEDPLLNGKIKYSLKKGLVYLGRKNGEPENDIILGGLGINQNHAILSYKEGWCYVEYFQKYNAENSGTIHVNGKKIEKKTFLNNYDKIAFGVNVIFLLKYNGEIIQKLEEIDWTIAQQEIVKQNQQMEIQEREKQYEIIKEQAETQIRDMEDALEQEKRQAEVLMSIQQKTYLRKLKELENRIQQETQKSMLLENQKQINKESQQSVLLENKKQIDESYKNNIQSIENNIQQRQIIYNDNVMQAKMKETSQKLTLKKQQSHLEEKLAKYLPKIIEANLCAKELQRNIQFSPKLSYLLQSDTDQIEKNKKLKIQIKLINHDSGCVHIWNMKKFQNRYYIIKDILDQYFDTNELPELSQNDDPFWDPPEPQFIGQSFQKLMSLAYIMDNPSELTIVGENGTYGTISVNLIPTDETGLKNLGEIMEENGDIVEDPIELVGKPFHFKVIISSLQLTENDLKSIYVEYTMQNQQEEIQTYKSGSQRIISNDGQLIVYENLHSFQNLSFEFLTFLLQNNICYNVYGYQSVTQYEENKKQNQIIRENMYQTQTSLGKKSRYNTQQHIKQKKKKTIEDFNYNQDDDSDFRLNYNTAPKQQQIPQNEFKQNQNYNFQSQSQDQLDIGSYTQQLRKNYKQQQGKCLIF